MSYLVSTSGVTEVGHALHLPTQGPRVGSRGKNSISWVGDRTRSLVKPVAVIQEIDWVGDNVTPVVAPRNCQTLPHCDSLTTANQAVVSILLFDGYFQHHFPDMDVSVRVCLLLKYTCTVHLLTVLLTLMSI